MWLVTEKGAATQKNTRQASLPAETNINNTTAAHIKRHNRKRTNTTVKHLKREELERQDA